MKHRIITIAGALGSGKSSTAKQVAQTLGYKHFSSGDVFRAVAKERGVTVEEINKVAELEAEIDHAVDEKLRMMASEHNFVIDSRLAFHWMPESFKVYLSLDPKKAAERIYAHIKAEGRVSQEAESVEHVLAATLARKESEEKRYKTLYNIDTNDMTPFDLVIDTATNDLASVCSQVLLKYAAWIGE